MKTRNSLFTSVIALVLCVSMLLGTTYAWFTDVATSKDNVIQTGNLDVTMEWANDFDATTWQDATAGAIFTHDNWEPGYTDVKYIKITNKGDLNLKWRLTLEAEGAVSKLSDVIGVYCVNPATEKLTSINGLTAAGTLTNVLNNKNNFAPEGRLAVGAEVIVAMAMHMDEDAGNEYKGLSLCNTGFSVKIVATQDVGESDSFGDDYDKDAEWPEFKMDFEATKSLEGIGTNYNHELVTEVIIRHGSGAYAIVPAGTKLAEGATELKFTGKNVEANGNFADNARSYDIHIEGIADDNSACITVYLGAILAKDLSDTSLKLYHEDVQMWRVNSVADFAIKDQYTYDPATGEVVLYVDNFSIFSAVQTTPDEWDGTSDTSWYNENDTVFTLTTAEQFAGFRDLVDGGNTFAGKTVKLGADIDLNDKLFDPIGYNYAHLDGQVFMGTFDGANHTVYNLYQNGWDLDPDKTNYSTYTYSTAGGGLFASIKDATIKNLAVSGANIVFECVDIGIVVGYAQGTCHFENIIVTNSQIANYNRATGGVVGEVCFGNFGTDTTKGYSHTFKNITVDSSVVVSSLWGSFDTLCGGVIGGKWGDATVKMEDVIVAAELDVFSDVTAAYQWYAYRRCGMLIGHTEQNSPKKALNAAAEFLTCEDVYVYYGDWTNYTYYQFTNQDIAWQNNYPWVRAQAGLNNGAFSNARYGNPIIKGEKINTFELAEANKTAYTPIIFNQLYGGGQGVYGCNEHTGVTISNRDKKTVYIKNDAEWENLKLYYWFANGDDTWTTLIDGIALTGENGLYKVSVPAYAQGFRITADGDKTTPDFDMSTVIDGALYDLNCEHIHDYQWIIDRAPTDKLEGAKHEKCTACGDIRNENTPIAKLDCPGHTPLTKVEAKAATCLEKGWTEYYTCLTCKKIYADANGYFEIHEKDYEIPALGHKLVDGICQNVGCGENFNRTITLMNGNTVVKTVLGVVGEEIPTLPVLQRANYYFEGWYTDSACNNLFKETTFSEDVTLYAKWVAIDTTNEMLTIMSLNADKSNAIRYDGKVKVAVKDAGVALGDLPDIICLQNLGANWATYPETSSDGYYTNIDGYTAHYYNRTKNEDNIVRDGNGTIIRAKHFIYYKTGEFSVEGGGCSNYLSYIVLKRLSDKAMFVIVNVWSYTSDEASMQAELNAIRDRIDGTWADQNRGLLPIIIAGSFYQAPEESIIYQSLTKDSQFFDVSQIEKNDKTPGSTAATGDYIFVSYHMQSSVESYGLLTNTGNYRALYASLAFQNETCSHLLANKTEAKPATCFEEGNVEYYTCSFCGKFFADELAAIELTSEELVIPAFGSHEPGAAATCETAKTCTRCGEELAPALGHAWTNDCDPDCNNSCGETREPDHDYQWVVPTPGSEGVKHEECTVCGDKRNENTPIEESTETTSP